MVSRRLWSCVRSVEVAHSSREEDSPRGRAWNGTALMTKQEAKLQILLGVPERPYRFCNDITTATCSQIAYMDSFRGKLLYDFLPERGKTFEEFFIVTLALERYIVLVRELVPSPGARPTPFSVTTCQLQGLLYGWFPGRVGGYYPTLLLFRTCWRSPR